MTQQDGTLSVEEVARFNALASEWWNPTGPMAPLHRMNRLRTDWVERQLHRRFPGGLQGEILDVGCGAGLLSEALAMRGYPVLGIDAAADAIGMAESHAGGRGLPLRYRNCRIEALAEEGACFELVTALELIEHVPDPAAFLQILSRLVAPGGLLVISTLNRTLRSLMFAKVGAEYLLRQLPMGTHDWRSFMAPRALARLAGDAGLRPVASAGMSFDILRQRWNLTRDLSINYIAAFEKPPLA